MNSKMKSILTFFIILNLNYNSLKTSENRINFKDFIDSQNLKFLLEKDLISKQEKLTDKILANINIKIEKFLNNRKNRKKNDTTKTFIPHL